MLVWNSETVVCASLLESRMETANARKETYLCLCRSSCLRICVAAVAYNNHVYTHPFGNPNQVGDDLNLVPSGLHSVSAVGVGHVHS